MSNRYDPAAKSLDLSDLFHDPGSCVSSDRNLLGRLFKIRVFSGRRNVYESDCKHFETSPLQSSTRRDCTCR